MIQRNLKEKNKSLIFFRTYSMQTQRKLVLYIVFKSVIYNTCQEIGSYTKL